MKKTNLLPLILLSFPLISCGGMIDPAESTESISYDYELTVTVNYYVDYNAIIAKEIYATETVKNGEKLTKPADPTSAPFPEFPVFKGWSKYEIVDDTSKIFNFDKDVCLSTTATMNMFGIWVAQGE